MTDSLFPLFHGFEIRETAGGFFLVDRAEFNNWGAVYERAPFATRQEAIKYAFACDQFKRGRRMTLN